MLFRSARFWLNLSTTLAALTGISALFADNCLGRCRTEVLADMTRVYQRANFLHANAKAEEEAGLASRSRYVGWAPAVAMNMQYLSVRDMILLYAECLANDGELSAAMEQVNKIRTRAGNAANIIQFPDGKGQKYVVKTYPSTHAAFTDKNTCIAAIRFERKLELAKIGRAHV